MPSFPGVDFLDFDSLLSDEEKLARQSARQFVDEEILPIIEQCNREGKFPTQLVPKMAELGLFGASLKGYGCAGMSNVEYGLVTHELERGDSGLRSFVSVQSALVMYPIFAFGSDAQKDKWLPLLQQGKAIGCFGLTEPQFGSNPGGMLTRAKKDGDSYILNGEKMWITNGSISDVAVVWAKCEDEKIRGFLVEKGTPGFKAWDVHGKYSLRASVTSGLAMSDCRIPTSNLLRGVEGLRGPLSCLNQARYGIGWGGIGAAMACYDTALQYAKQRKQFGNKPIASHQLVQEKLVWMITEITKAQFLALQVGRLKDQGRVHPSHISMLKMNNVWVARECASRAREILGANGIVDDYCVMRHMNNIESVYTYEGTNDIHKLIIGERITGIAAFE
jgi:glutaryl-CoA dehydrogenase